MYIYENYIEALPEPVEASGELGGLEGLDFEGYNFENFEAEFSEGGAWSKFEPQDFIDSLDPESRASFAKHLPEGLEIESWEGQAEFVEDMGSQIEMDNNNIQDETIIEENVQPDTSRGREVVDNGIEKATNENGELKNKSSERVEKKMNEVIEEMKRLTGEKANISETPREPLSQAEKIEIQRKLAELEEMKKSGSSTMTDMLALVLKLAAMLVPLLGYWFLYSLLRYTLSDCYWIPVNEKCKIEGEGADDWNKLQKTKKRMPKADTENDIMSVVFGGKPNNGKTRCECNTTNKVLTVRGDKNEKSLGIIEVVDGKTPGNKGCTSESDKAGCQNKEDYPTCLIQKNPDSDADRHARLECHGVYKFDDVDLNKMVTNASEAAKDLLEGLGNLMPMIKKIIYVIVIIIIVYFCISVIRYIMKNRSQK